MFFSDIAYNVTNIILFLLLYTQFSFQSFSTVTLLIYVHPHTLDRVHATF